MRTDRTLIAIAAFLALTSRAVADPSAGSGAGSGSEAAPVDDFPARIPGLEFIHFRSHLQVHTFGGSDLSLPRGYYMDEGKYGELDAHVKDIENQITRLTAENQSYQASLDAWRPGWMTMLTVVALGFAGGWYLHEKL